MKKQTKILLILAVLLAVGNIVFLMGKYQTSLQPVFSEEAMKNHPLLQKKASDTVAEVQEKAKALPASAFSRGASERTSEIFEEFFQTIKDEDTFRIKVWDRNYTVIWANVTELIGKRFPENHEVQESLDGEVEIEIKRGKPENYTERAFSNFSEIYVPIKDDSGRVVGSIEVYEVTEDIVAQLRDEFYKAAGISIGASLVIFILAAFSIKALVK